MKNKYPILTMAAVEILLKGLVTLEDLQNELVTQPGLFADIRALYLARRKARAVINEDFTS